MFFDNPEFTHKVPVEIFIDEYMNRADDLPEGFESQVHLYTARTYLSIIYYLVKVGKGSSENFRTILVEAERSLSHMAFNKALI